MYLPQFCHLLLKAKLVSKIPKGIPKTNKCPCIRILSQSLTQLSCALGQLRLSAALAGHLGHDGVNLNNLVPVSRKFQICVCDGYFCQFDTA